MNDWQPTMQIREVWWGLGLTPKQQAIQPPRFLRIEQLYRHIHTGDTEWRPIERMEEP